MRWPNGAGNGLSRHCCDGDSAWRRRLIAIGPHVKTLLKSRRVVQLGVIALTAGLLVNSPGAAGVQNEPRSGEAVVDAACIACHGSGANGAPKIGDKKAWSQRAAQGLTSLSRSAINGIRKMPPHGGNSGVTDFEIERAITYMVNQSGGDWIEPIDRSSVASDRRGEQVVGLHCGKCHETGAGGAPKVGDTAAWIPRLTLGLDPLVRSAINGHGGMPSRGGSANLTDAELRAAIVYMLNGGAAPARISTAGASGPNFRIVEGVTINFGVVPAEVIRANASKYPKSVYGEAPATPDQYYVCLLYTSPSPRD